MTGTLHTAKITAIGSTITGTASRTLGNRLTERVNVKDFGALGDDSHDDTTNIQAAADAAFGSSGSPHGATYGLNRALYFPTGVYKITDQILLTSVLGGLICGDGRFASYIKQYGVGKHGFKTNGCSYTSFENFSIEVLTHNSISHCIYVGGTSATSPTVNVQSNVFRQMNIGGGFVGIGLGVDGEMGSENTIHDIYFNLNKTAIQSFNQNALMNRVYGGNIAGGSVAGSVGIKISGSFGVISGVSFQTNAAWDIWFTSGALQDSIHVYGCRSEQSPNFFKNEVGVGAHLNCCGSSDETGKFAEWVGHMTMTNCNFGGTLGATGGNSLSGSGNMGITSGSGGSVWSKISSGVLLLSDDFEAGSGFSSGGPYYSGGAINAAAFSRLPTARNSLAGVKALVTNSTTATVGATITGGGSNTVLAICTATGTPAWKVLAAL